MSSESLSLAGLPTLAIFSYRFEANQVDGSERKFNEGPQVCGLQGNEFLKFAKTNHYVSYSEVELSKQLTGNAGDNVPCQGCRDRNPDKKIKGSICLLVQLHWKKD